MPILDTKMTHIIDKNTILAYMKEYTMTVAATKLGIGTTSLKKLCRKNNITRWQHRQNVSCVNKLKRKISKLCILHMMSKTTLKNSAKLLGVKAHILRNLCKAYCIYSWKRSEAIHMLCTIQCDLKDVDTLMTTDEMIQEFDNDQIINLV